MVRMDFNIGKLEVGKLDTSSGIFSGENLQYGWRAFVKTSCPIGKITGDGEYVSHQKTVVNSDLLEEYVQKSPPIAFVLPSSPAVAGLWQQRCNKHRKTGAPGKQGCD